MHDAYVLGKDRRLTYIEMTERIMGAVRQNLEVCAVFYGHPGIFVNSSHMAIKQAREEGYAARMLPAVSAQDCLFADLGVDPADGIQIFEASNFLVRPRRFDVNTALVLFQIGIVGNTILKELGAFKKGLNILVDYLLKFYTDDHPIILYEASRLGLEPPLIQRHNLAELRNAPVKATTTLYIYP